MLCRHVLWAMPDPAAALRRWIDLLAPGGRLVLVEGRWSTGAGLTAAETSRWSRRPAARPLTLLPERRYWGREINDERYVVVSTRPLGPADRGQPLKRVSTLGSLGEYLTRASSG